MYSDVGEFYIDEINVHDDKLRHADSLVFHLQIEKGIDLYNDILASTDNDSVRSRVLYTLQELKYQLPFLYQKIKLNDTVEIKSGDYGFFYQLRNDPEKIKTEELDLMIASSSIKDQIKENLYKSIWMDLEILSDQDTMYSHAKVAYDLLSPYGYDNLLGLQVVSHLQKVVRYHRESLLGLSIVNDMLLDIDNSKADEDIINLLNVHKGNLYIDLGEYDLAQQQFNQVKNAYNDQQCNDHYHRALISQLYLSLLSGNNSLSDSIVTQIKKSLDCPDRVSNLERWIGRHELDRNKEISLEYYEKARSFELSIPFTSDGAIESISYNLSELHQKLGNYKIALETYWENKGKNYSYQKLLDLKPTKNIWVIYERFASIHYSNWLKENTQQDLYATIDILLKAESTINTLMRSTEESTLLDYKYYQNNIYKILAQAYYDLYEITQDSEYKNAVVESLSKRKNLILTKEILTQQGTKNIPTSILKEKKELEMNVTEIKQKYNYNHPTLSSILWNFDSLNQIIASYHDGPIDYYQLNKRMSIDTIQELLGDRSLLSYSILDEQLFITLMNQNKIHIIQRKFDEGIESKLNKLGLWQADPTVDMSLYTILAQECYQTLFPAELVPLLSSQLVIVPDGGLNYINFEALISPNNQSKSDTPSYLLHDYKITTLPSEQLLNSTNNKIIIDQNSKVDVFSYTDKASILQSQNAQLSELPWALEEANFIAKRFHQCELYTGKKATVLTFINSLEKENDLLHVATHGISSSTSRYDTKLYFRNSDLSIDSIYGYELLDVDIATPLIILTSCQSGTGTQAQGEGVYDLKRYMLAQGAKEVMVSLWDLDDQSTCNIMQLFYAQDTPDLQQAKIQFLSSHADKVMPFYWAGLSY